jgi:hypothetical protein
MYLIQGPEVQMSGMVTELEIILFTNADTGGYFAIAEYG